QGGGRGGGAPRPPVSLRPKAEGHTSPARAPGRCYAPDSPPWARAGELVTAPPSRALTCRKDSRWWLLSPGTGLAGAARRWWRRAGLPPAGPAREAPTGNPPWLGWRRCGLIEARPDRWATWRMAL